MNDIQENLNDHLNHSNHSTPSVAEDTTVKPDMNCHQAVCSASSVITPDSENREHVKSLITSTSDTSEVPVHVIPESDLQCFNSSNIMTDPPVENDGDSIESTGNTGNHPVCLNSSNDENIVKSPLRLRTLCTQYLLQNIKLSKNQIEKLMKCRIPVHLKTMCTSVLLESFPGLDIDQALTNLAKYKIVDTTTDQTQRDAMPYLDLNAFLKTLALKRKMKVLVPKVGCTTVNRWTKKVPHWSLLDPYSDLEDQGSNTPTDEDTSRGDSSDRNCGVHFTRISGHVLWRRTRSYSSDRT